jgi:hypothetical protein
MMFNPHKLGIHKLLQHIPLGPVFDAPYKRMLKRAVNIADLRAIAKARSHKVSLLLTNGCSISESDCDPSQYNSYPFQFILISLHHSSDGL